MRLLLDTHVAVCALTDPDRISRAGRSMIVERDNTLNAAHVVATEWPLTVLKF